MKPDGGIFWGKMIVGTATLMFVFVLISGIVIWWPRTKKALKNSLKIVSGKGCVGSAMTCMWQAVCTRWFFCW